MEVCYRNLKRQTGIRGNGNIYEMTYKIDYQLFNTIFEKLKLI
mgnify:CR=1 FL=1